MTRAGDTLRLSQGPAGSRSEPVIAAWRVATSSSRPNPTVRAASNTRSGRRPSSKRVRDLKATAWPSLMSTIGWKTA